MTHIYAASGIYNVTLTVADMTSGESATATLNNAFKANPGLKETPLTSEQHLELNIGLTAQIDAIMNFNSKK